MSIQSADLARLLLATTLLVVLAHLVGGAFSLMRQPRVIGEILGGLLLGPTVLGALWPYSQAALFPSSGVVASGLGIFSELGLLLLMFLSGQEALTYRSPGGKRAVTAVTVTGLALPLAIGLGLAQLVNAADFSGPNGNSVTFALVFGIGIAVTSIPVISRIMLDLGILGTRFAKVVLSVAVLEDVVLYVALAVLLGLAKAKSSSTYGLWSLFHNHSATATTVYYVLASLAFLGVFMLAGRPLFAALSRSRFNPIERRSPVAFRLTYMLVLVVGCVFLGINPIFGAVLAGASTASADNTETEPVRRADLDRAWDSIKRFSLALFIPLYFAGVGVQLDLLHHFTVLFFLVFLVLACAVKSASVWLGARLAGESARASTHFAIALNARGGPGIVLATVTLAAGVINKDFFTVLVLLSVVTSELAGLWLQHVFMPELTSGRSGERHHVDATATGGREPVHRTGSGPDAGTP